MARQRDWWLEPVAAALDAAPAPVEVFFRDDDAGWADERLLELLDRFAAAGLPLDLAVIPAATTPQLGRELRARERVGLHQHGLAHVNHEREGRKCEFGPSRPHERQRADIAAGRERLRELLGDRLQPIFTPPWNRCTADTGRALAELGFAGLSREHRADPLGIPGLPEAPVHVDWVRLEPAELAARMAAQISDGGPLGVMLHHEVMPDMDPVGELLALVADHDRALPRPMIELL
jgi:peptidoglycan/xylan/chitin deacetylase (PgdA/CDA1 family)